MIKIRGFAHSALRVDDAERSKAFNSCGNLATPLGRYEDALKHYGQSLEIRRELGDRSGIAYSLNNLGIVAREQGDYVAARALY